MWNFTYRSVNVARNCVIKFVLILDCLLYFTFIVIIDSSYGMRIGTGEEDASMRGKFKLSSPYIMFEYFSKLQCGALCVSTDCVSIFHNSVSSVCVINSKLEDVNTGLSSGKGWRHFTFKGNYHYSIHVVVHY